MNRLLLSDGGVVDNSLELAKKFPRVEVLDHRHYQSLGKCIAKLIEHVDTEWFIYLHSDVYLPDGWFDTMMKYQGQYDWYGCPMQITVAASYRPPENSRPYAGSQMGKKEAFDNLDIIDDDFVYRQEDFVFNKLVIDNGYTPGKIEDTFHYHQVMYRESKGFDIKIKNVHVDVERSEEETARTNETQLRGVVKYLDPDEPWALSEFQTFAKLMHDARLIEYRSFRNWIQINNPEWLSVYNRKFWIKYKIEKFTNRISKMVNRVSRTISYLFRIYI